MQHTVVGFASDIPVISNKSAYLIHGIEVMDITMNSTYKSTQNRFVSAFKNVTMVS